MQPNTLHKVSEHVWWFTPESRTDRASIGLVVGANSSLMLEAGASPAHTRQFLQAIKDTNLPYPKFAILTHWHWDHCFGIEVLDIPVFAYRETAQNIQRMMSYDFSDTGLAQLVADGLEIEFCREHMILEMTNDERKNLKLRMPDIIFDAALTFNLGGVTVQVEHVGGDHAADSCVMHIPEDKVLFLGDCIYMTVYEEPRHYTAKIKSLLRKIIGFDAQQFIEGHSDEIVTRAEMQRMLDTIGFIYAMIKVHGRKNVGIIQEALCKLDDHEEALEFLDLIIAGIKNNEPQR